MSSAPSPPLDVPAPLALRRVTIAVVVIVGLVCLGWAVLGLHTSAGVDLYDDATPAEESYSVTCEPVMAEPRDGGVVEVRRGDDVLDEDDLEDELVGPESVASVVAACHQARDRRLGRSLLTGAAGAAILALSGSLGRRRRAYLA